MQTCVRTDRDLGIRERIAFVPRDGDRQLFTCLHEPDGAITGAVLICPSVLADFVSNYQREVHLARELAAAGVATLRYHPTGMGDSDGDPARVTLDTLSADAVWATDALRTMVGNVPIGFLGVRWGALAAVAAARAIAPPPVPMVLIEPVADFRRFFREAWRSRAMSALAASDDPAAKKQKLVDVLSSQGFADIVGNVLHRPLYDSAENVDALGEFDGVIGETLVVQFRGKELRPELRAVVERLRAGGGAVDTATADVEESWWFRSGPRIILDPELNEIVTTWVVEHLARVEAADDRLV